MGIFIFWLGFLRHYRLYSEGFAVFVGHWLVSLIFFWAWKVLLDVSVDVSEGECVVGQSLFRFFVHFLSSAVVVVVMGCRKDVGGEEEGEGQGEGEEEAKGKIRGGEWRRRGIMYFNILMARNVAMGYDVMEYELVWIVYGFVWVGFVKIP